MRLSPRLYAKQLVVACLAEPQRVNELVNKFWQRIWLDKKFSWRKSIVQEVGSVWHELTRRAEVKVSARRQLHPVEQKFIGKEITKKFGQEGVFLGGGGGGGFFCVGGGGLFKRGWV